MMGDFIKLYTKLIGAMVLMFLVWCVVTPIVFSYENNFYNYLIGAVDGLLPILLTWYFYTSIGKFIRKYSAQPQ